MVTAWSTHPRLPRSNPPSLSTRLLVTYLTLTVLTVGGIIVFTGERFAVQVLERRGSNLETQAEAAAIAIGDPLDNFYDHEDDAAETITLLVNSYAQSNAARVFILDPDRNILFTSDVQIPTQVERDQDELRAARNGTPTPIIRMDEWQNEERLYAAAPMFTNGTELLGFVQFSVPTAPMHAEIMQIWLSLLGVGALVLALTALASILIARQLAAPIQTVTRTSEQIAAGRLDQRIAPAGPDEIRRLGLAFNLMTERVQAMLNQQRTFVDNAAHELRSPLTSLRLHLDLLQARHQNSDETTRQHLQEMEREIAYLQRMVSQLLALSSVVESDQVAPKGPLDLARLLYELADEMDLVVKQAGLTLNVDVPDHLPLLDANAEQMTIMARNLLDNAVKYTPPGGTILLMAKTLENGIEIWVTDTGVGIPAEALPHIFERFYRVDQAHSRRPSVGAADGAGLGLALVQDIVQAHGGRIQVESRVNAGSTFVIWLPFRREQANGRNGNATGSP